MKIDGPKSVGNTQVLEPKKAESNPEPKEKLVPEVKVEKVEEKPSLATA